MTLQRYKKNAKAGDLLKGQEEGTEKKKGKSNIAPLNHLPLLSSEPGGFTGAGRIDLPIAKVSFF